MIIKFMSYFYCCLGTNIEKDTELSMDVLTNGRNVLTDGILFYWRVV